VERHLSWDGVRNARDLGGLPAAGGRVTRRGALVRADALDRLSAEGWRSLEAHGVRTVLDLRNDDERGNDTAPRPAAITTVQLPLDAMDDRKFWDVWATGPQFGTPLYYGPHLERFPERIAAVVSAIARAAPGGVAFHCGVGRDRAGLVALVLLGLLGVPAGEIAADYGLSEANLAHLDDTPVVAAYLADRGTSAATLVRELAEATDLEAVIRAGGATDEDLEALRARATERPQAA
jgi:protein-tyrosine phosphatase